MKDMFVGLFCLFLFLGVFELFLEFWNIVLIKLRKRFNVRVGYWGVIYPDDKKESVNLLQIDMNSVSVEVWQFLTKRLEDNDYNAENVLVSMLDEYRLLSDYVEKNNKDAEEYLNALVKQKED